MYEFRRCISVDLIPVCVPFMFDLLALCLCIYTTLGVVLQPLSLTATAYLCLLTECTLPVTVYSHHGRQGM